MTPPPAATYDPRSQATEPAIPPAKVEGAKSKTKAEQKGLQGQLEFKEFSRSPASVLRALSAEASTKQDGSAKKSASILQQLILRGDWQSLKQTLAEQPEAVGASLYGQVITGLAQRRSQVTLLPDDVLALADAAPKPLTAAESELLGQIAKEALGQVRGPEQFLAKIKAGTRRLGGDEPAKKLSTARLLMAADLIDDAAAYFPPMADIISSNDAELLNLYAQYLTVAAEKRQTPLLLAMVWELTQRVLELPEATEAQYAEAIQRSLKLLPILGDRGWVSGQLATDARGLRALSIVAGQAGPSSSEISSRLQAMTTVKLFGDQLVRLQNDQPNRSKVPLTMLTMLWIAEADLSAAVGPSQQGEMQRGITYINSRRARHMHRSGRGFIEEVEEVTEGEQQQNRPQPLPPAELLILSPSDSWCGTIEPDLSGRILRLKGSLAAATLNTPSTLQFAKQLSAAGDKSGAELTSTLLRNWANASVLPEIPSADSPYFIHGGGLNSQSDEGIPLTRARQVRRLQKLVELLAEIRSAEVKGDYDSALVGAFASCHSPAEVYRKEDVEEVFGKLTSISPQLAALLAEQMRTNLRGMWQRMEPQIQNNTNRTPEDQANEVQRGYALAVELLTLALKQEPEHLALHLSLASTLFDQAEFLYGQKADLKTYTQLRDRAFAEYAAAADIYSRSPDIASPGKQRVDIYGRWFSAALGASELSYLTSNDKPQRDQIDGIAQAMRSLGSPAADAHLRMFAESLIQSSRSMPAQLKPWCFREAQRILGDHPAAAPLRQLLQLYDELLAEIELGVQLDGGADVGANHPFGVSLSLRATRNLHREASSFTQLLSANSQGTANDPKEKIKTMIKDRLEKQFDIDAIQFHDVTTQPRSYGRDGWLEKPLAYLVLRAKTPAVDRIPALNVDLAFADGVSSVLLPVTSPPVLMSAAKIAQPAFISGLKVKQTFDDRLANDHVWQLEVKASATGLVCDLEQVLKSPRDPLGGFTITKVEPNAISVTGFDLSGKQIQPISQRSWTLHLAPVAGSASEQFTFPVAAVADAEVKRERYDDFDVVDAPPVIAARGQAGSSWLSLGNLGVGALVLLLAILAGAWWFLKRRQPAAPPAPIYRRPEPLTPFNLLALLRRIQTDEHLGLSESEQAALGETVSQLEGRYFARQDKPPGDVQLVDTLNRWLTRAASRNGAHAAARNGHLG